MDPQKPPSMYVHRSHTYMGNDTVSQILQINENGILSFRDQFRSTFIREFDSFTHFQPLIAPFWTDISLRSLAGGSVFFRMTRDNITLNRARTLTQQHFPDLNFEPTNAVIVTWFEVEHEFIQSVCYVMFIMDGKKIFFGAND